MVFLGNFLTLECRKLELQLERDCNVRKKEGGRGLASVIGSIDGHNPIADNNVDYSQVDVSLKKGKNILEERKSSRTHEGRSVLNTLRPMKRCNISQQRTKISMHFS
ncbi:hypothetical protein AVEN_28859-1 [Araneus ventricosus]|uniref:Uncharacterized protein n=1 Tax=Araneus ventricosus TaxID=182803 RepID=A0A4Y2FJ83_ARAVE|nr:hypothetical protein AVEN_28859-1 [Araneus ventricosus]